jgi:hypothetical protein
MGFGSGEALNLRQAVSELPNFDVESDFTHIPPI